MRKKDGRVFAYTVVILFLCAYGLRLVLPERVIENTAAYIMYPILLAQNKIVFPIKAYFEKRRSLEDCEALIKLLQSERENLVADNIQLQSVVSHMNQTQELLDFKNQYQMNDAVVVQILVKHFSDQSHYILIDKGLNAGISQDMVAIYKNCLLGKVVEVYPHYSKVLLVTDRLCKVAAFCPHTHASGIHQGKNQERQSGLHFVSHLSEIDPDDLVLSSGDGLIFPKGFALGKVKACMSNGLFYEINVEPLLDVRKINFCFLVQKGGKHYQINNEFIEYAEQQITATIVQNHELEMHNELIEQQKQEQQTAEKIAMMQIEQTRVPVDVEAQLLA